LGEIAMAIYGYARVSAKDQDFNGQIDELNRAGCAKVLAEKISGARADNRKELARAR
jgi:DNA invertase Pin-like site-specific DNA recombinase